MPFSRRGLLAALAALPAAAMATTARRIELDAAALQTQIAGESARLLAYNGSFPGPTLRWREGETARIAFRNRLEETTNLHFHGLHVPPDGNVDNVFLTLAPGEAFLYELTVPEGHGGLYWYHPHPLDRHRLAAQLWAGLAGPIVVESPVDREAALAACDEHVLVVRDLTLLNGAPAPARKVDWIRGRQGGRVLVNGTPQPALQARAGTVRLRLLNASNARYLRLQRGEGLPLWTIALDGRFLAAPVEGPEELVPPAGRIELLLPLRGEPLSLMLLPYNRGSVREPSAPEPLLTLFPSAAAAPIPLPKTLVPVASLEPHDGIQRRQIVMGSSVLQTVGVTHGHGHHPGFTVPAGSTELWEVRNVDTQDHVFHLHTWHFQVWRKNGRPSDFPAWRDTVGLRPGDRLELLVPFERYTGRSLYHCHIAEHGGAGMMAVFAVR
jgi:FtsP/CotA-like multicopper oxidase with cupredoxin domain